MTALKIGGLGGWAAWLIGMLLAFAAYAALEACLEHLCPAMEPIAPAGAAETVEEDQTGHGARRRAELRCAASSIATELTRALPEATLEHIAEAEVVAGTARGGDLGKRLRATVPGLVTTGFPVRD